MTVKRVRHARLQMRLLARKRAFLPLVRLVRSAAGWAGAIPALAQNLILILGAAVAYFAVTTPLSNQGQLAFALISLGGALIIRPLPGRLITQILIVISIIASSRYLYWRATETLQLSDRTDLFFGTGLFLAEMYAWIILLLGFFQTAWPLERKPIPMPEDRSLWPTIDVFIPTRKPLNALKIEQTGAYRFLLYRRCQFLDLTYLCSTKRTIVLFVLREDFYGKLMQC